MERAPGRAHNGQHGRGDGAWDATSDARVEALRQRFARFRRAHEPRTRYPRNLRAAVLAALRGGVAEPELRRACGLSADQLAAWRRREQIEAQQDAKVTPPPRVFSVVDEFPGSHPDRAVPPVGEDVELFICGWAVRIRRVEG